MVRLFCCIYGEKGSAFCASVDAEDIVGELKDVIAAKLKVKFPANRLRLFLAYHDGAWLKSESDDVKKLNKGRQTAVLVALTAQDKELSMCEYVGEVLKDKPKPTCGQIYLLVKAPRGSIWDDYTWDPPTVEHKILSASQQSVVRLSSPVGSGAALVVDRTTTHVYLMTSLHLWIDEAFAEHLSDKFK
ncbi:hypothetical protein PHYSODRAFT_531866 [Phytophthora sojae]|uniref:Crinkler effector protein N-terminal domain-containing protein n=1 Tax=Phytophthora sojae (strain P6497) TaxID=1094619 RepID=G5AD97_PHYSP|nr:hypothetical protein PHYSODRAFT_531866 [Phytophthora sojae]EGZ06150.1 hypothetical protein PHYSODRAFT_531866 [Phytophthora sojae]|eukprot:XP_009538047.1 hypothetical protein PHYSODRAFT_531866 [Phytophthora sojae]